MRIYLDDERDPPTKDRFGEPLPEWTVVRTAQEAIALVATGQVEFIDFDHDLGTKLTGYDVAQYIELLAVDNLIPPIGFAIHSGNPVGAGNIDRAMKSAHRFWEQHNRKN
jgi:hypothetical protein